MRKTLPLKGERIQAWPILLATEKLQQSYPWAHFSCTTQDSSHPAKPLPPLGYPIQSSCSLLLMMRP